MSKGSNTRPYNGERFRNNFDGIRGFEAPKSSVVASAMAKLKARGKCRICGEVEAKCPLNNKIDMKDFD